MCPSEIKGYLELKEEKWYKDEVEHIIADGILSEVVSTKGSLRKVKNFNADTQEYEKVSYLIEQDGVFSHGATAKEAKEDLVFKLLTKDLSDFEDYTVDTELSFEEIIVMYRSITGACSQGVKDFIEGKTVKERYTIKEIITITEGRLRQSTI